MSAIATSHEKRSLIPMVKLRSLANSVLRFGMSNPQSAPAQTAPNINQERLSDTFAFTPAPPLAQQIQAKLAVIQQVIRPQGVSASFEQQVKQLLLKKVPTPILSRLAQQGFTLDLKHHITANQPEKESTQFYLNERGGLYEPARKSTTVAENVHQLKTQPPIWIENQYWQNSVIHELGHVIADDLGQKVAQEMPFDHPDKKRLEEWGLSEHALFRQAWEKDYQAMPNSFKSQESPIAYYVQDHQQVPFGVGRQETFAECVDILLRGSASTYNFQAFTQHFPNTLNATKTLLEQGFDVNLSWPLILQE